ncbi:TonB-dependent receptor [Edaphobacter aggregans]|uniref:TonB-dependent receptor n=1 Tax=Edaphobacter aggregans TaxID=570835 RepID=UPI0006904746|nr:carboxypeptidase-like regulatory domain-containing protein [Edaphobacter aggregans]
MTIARKLLSRLTVSWITIAILSLSGLVGTERVAAQNLYGTLTGNVTDQTGAAIVGASVTVVNTLTGFQRTGATNGDGIFLFQDLQQGVYTVTVTAPSYADLKIDGIHVEPNQIVRQNAQLNVGTVSQELQVTTAMPVLQTDKADVNAEINPVQLAELPTTSSYGRNFQSLYKFVPGFTPPAEQNSTGGNPMRAQASNANGVSWAANSTRVDGATVSYPWLPYLIAYVPPQDAIQSVNVVTNSFTADQGTAGGASINVTIKSGTNKFHGTAFEYNSINQYNARNYYQSTTTLRVRPKNIYNEFGGSIGGPIFRDKLFFFFDADRITRVQGTSGFQTIPTPQLINGDFTGYLAGTTQAQIYDPRTGQTTLLSGNGGTVRAQTGVGRASFATQDPSGRMIIPASRISAAAKKMLSLLPAPNNCVNNCYSSIANNYVGSAASSYTMTKYDTKINYNPNEKNTIFGRYSIAPYAINDPPALGAANGSPFDGGNPGALEGRIQNVGLGLTHLFAQNLLLTVNAGYARQRIGGQGPDFGTNYGLDTLGIPGTNGPDIEQSGQPGFVFSAAAASGFGGGASSSGSAAFSSIGNQNTASPFKFRDNQYVENINLVWNKGRHSFAFGAEHTHSAINHFQPQGSNVATPRGGFQFTGGLTTIGGTTPTIFNQLADFLLGLPQTFGKAVQVLNPNAVRWSTFAGYAQDQWQFSPKLTLTLGARYEYYPFATRDHEGVFRFDPTLGRTNNVVIGGKGGNPTDTGEEIGWGMIVPRLGVAYRATQHTVLRAGFGITVDPDNFRRFRETYGAVTNVNSSGANGYTANDCLLAADAANSVTGCGTGTGTVPGTQIVGIPNIPAPDYSTGFLTLPSNVSTETVPKKFRRGYIESWNAAVQQDLMAGFNLNLTYVGTQAVRAITSLNINAAPPGGGTTGRLLYTSVGSTSDITSNQPFRGASYHSLQTQLSRRVGRGVNTALIYTWSHAINYNDNSTYSGLLFNYLTYWDRNKGTAGFDRTNNLQWWVVAQSPFGKNGHWLTTGFAGKVLGDWELNTALSKLSGVPFTVTDATTVLNAPGNSQVADLVKPNVMIGKTYRSGTNAVGNLPAYFDTTAFAPVTGAPRFGTSSRNMLRGPGLFNLDASIVREFGIWGERLKLQLRAESFNVTNTPAFANPNANISGANFGKVTALAANTGGRSVNLSGRINF